MPLIPLSLAIVGADYPNKRGPSRRFELAMCRLGEPVELRPEPKNPKDPYAIAVYSARGIQLGYISAHRALLMRKWLSDGHEVRAIYQGAAAFGGWARVAFDGEEPVLPPAGPSGDEGGDDGTGFYSDPIYDD